MRSLPTILVTLSMLVLAKADAQFELTQAVSGLFQPVDLAFNNVEDRHYIVEKPGRLRIWANGALVAQPYLDISNQVNNSGGEQGMLGLAFSPNFATDSSLFVYYITWPNNTRLSRFRATPGAASVDPATEQVLLEFAQPRNNHNGGSLAFGADGMLYVASGDGGGAGDPDNYAQNLSSFLGKMLRLDVTTDPGSYQVPADNPFVGNSNGWLTEIWSYGWRNPWRHSFDRLTGDMWVADVGQNAREEIDLETFGSAGGGNYGWRCREGDIPFNTSGDCDGPFVEPVHSYVTDELADGCSVSGGAVYRGNDHPVMEGNYYYTDFCSGKIFELSPAVTGGGWTNREIYQGADQQYAAIRENLAGELFVIAFVEGALYQLTNSCDPLGTLTVNQPVCAGEFGSIEFVPSNTSDPITLTIVGPTADLTQLVPGDYQLQIADGTGDCVDEYAFTIVPGEDLMPGLRFDFDELTISDTSGVAYASYQWIYEGQVLSGATDSSYTVSLGMDGTYQLVVTSALGCTDTAMISVVLGSTNTLAERFGLQVFPNPVQDVLQLRLDDWSVVRALRLRSATGQVIHSLSLGQTEGRQAQQVNIADKVLPLDISALDLAPGVYLLELDTPAGVLASSVVKR